MPEPQQGPSLLSPRVKAWDSKMGHNLGTGKVVELQWARLGEEKEPTTERWISSLPHPHPAGLESETFPFDTCLQEGLLQLGWTL